MGIFFCEKNVKNMYFSKCFILKKYWKNFLKYGQFFFLSQLLENLYFGVLQKLGRILEL